MTIPSEKPIQRVPTEKPPFTLGEIKRAIPPHCFKRSLLKSLSYVVHDLTFESIFYYVATNYFDALPSLLRYLAWPMYWAAQGCVLMGVWVIAHECGHHAFSDYQWVDNCVGLMLHSALLVPYFSWKYSHRRHHSNTASLDRDENHVPSPKSQLSWYTRYSVNPLGRVVILTVMLTLGWPMYLLFSIKSRPYDRFACHFDPYSPIYSDQERLQIYISDLGIMAAFYALLKIAVVRGVTWLVCVYGIPLLIVNAFLVMITYLHHTHQAIPHYDSSEWDWLRGALATVDRDYGILNKVFHNISNTHVAHHLFSTIPHYHAVEATKAIKPILGEYYRFDGTPFYKAMCREARECIYVEADDEVPSKGVYWYKNKF